MPRDESTRDYKVTNKDQFDKFKQAAHGLECDDDLVRFDAMVKKITMAGSKKPEDDGKVVLDE